MTAEQLECLLKLWGRAFGESRPSEWDEPHGSSPIAKLERPPRDARHIPAAWVRGKARLAAMGQSAGIARAPGWAADPITATETRSGHGNTFDVRITYEVQAVQDAWLALHRFHAKHAEVVRVQYQVRAVRQAEKAEGLGISRSRYNEMLASGKLWIHARMAD